MEDIYLPIWFTCEEGCWNASVTYFERL